MHQLWKIPAVQLTSDEISNHAVAVGMIQEAIGGR
jgi:hypothetical protein